MSPRAWPLWTSLLLFVLLCVSTVFMFRNVQATPPKPVKQELLFCLPRDANIPRMQSILASCPRAKKILKHDYVVILWKSPRGWTYMLQHVKGVVHDIYGGDAD